MEEDKEEYKRFTISLPQELYDKVERIKTQLNCSRSECIRKAMNAFMISEVTISDPSAKVVGCITMIMIHEHIKHRNDQDDNHNHEHLMEHKHEHHHDHEYSSKPIYANVQQRDTLLAKDIQHHYNDIVLSTLHIHLEFERCMEIIAVSGPYERVKTLHESLQKLRSVVYTGFFVADREVKLIE
jgi:metal-responsive CopG/Arc/MetJ family transcriptional regulator